MPKAFARRANGADDPIARALGWFSIGLGLAELVAPRRLSETIGLERRSNLVRAYGLREIAVGVGLVASRRPGPWLWTRVAGDVVDLATMTPGLRNDDRIQKAAAGAMATVAVITLLDLYCAWRSTARASSEPLRKLKDYSDRSGFPQAADKMVGAALRS
jgi:hypothetical protein